ncbi:MAG TPA: ABC transporter ATP-binding protein [Dehalococcoidia bacterium]|nr:ABC transporter ATP-binding protein [Dehalococcoidia bacterium]
MTDPEKPPLALTCTDLRKSYGSVVAVNDISLDVAQGELVALLGPSGGGKTTTLRLIAGFEQPDRGSVQIGGNEVAGPGRFQPPERRHVGMVFQDYALFSHLTVAANVAYGLQGNGASGVAATIRGWTKRKLGKERSLTNRVREILNLVELTDMAQRYPDELSGGEAQRVALARALAPAPDLILLDEPFSNLDAQLRASVRAEVREILRRAGAAAIFVTHDQEEAFSLADRVVVMYQGKVVQTGTPGEIYRHPATRFVASFVGDADFLPGQVRSDGVHTEIGIVPTPRSVDTADVEVMLRPESFLVEAHAPGDDPSPEDPLTNAGEVIGREYYGHDQMLTVRLRSGRLIRARLGPSEAFGPGDQVRLRLQGETTVFPAEVR